jgi:transcriptional regulator with XRE-family HTH domain
MSSVLHQIIATNISELRLADDISREKLAESLSVSVSDVELWESGELIPDVIVLKRLADGFGVSVDYLLTRTHREKRCDASAVVMRRRSRITIAALSFIAVWVLATLAFSLMLVFGITAVPFWMPFVYAVPLSFVPLVVFNSLWGDVKYNVIFSTVILWGLITSAYLTLLFLIGQSVWAMFLVGIPLEIALMFIPCTGIVKYTFFKKRGLEK